MEKDRGSRRQASIYISVTQFKIPRQAYAKLQTAYKNSRHFKLELYFPVLYQEIKIVECVNEKCLILN